MEKVCLSPPKFLDLDYWEDYKNGPRIEYFLARILPCVLIIYLSVGQAASNTEFSFPSTHCFRILMHTHATFQHSHAVFDCASV